jgi:hypothetical protein
VEKTDKNLRLRLSRAGFKPNNEKDSRTELSQVLLIITL